MSENHDMPAPMGEAAYHGIVGTVIEALLPYSEADPHALVVNLLVLFGNRVGRCARYMVPGGRAMHPNEFAVVVGETGAARKSTATEAILAVWALVEPAFEASPGYCAGLGSGEGLLWRVRDPWTGADGLADPGIADKRLLVVVDEFDALLASMGRDGSTLAELLKTSFGGGVLQTAVKGHLQRASQAHISLMACSTRDQLLAALSSRRHHVRKSDGFLNRFLWILAKRSKRLSRLTQEEAQALDEGRAEVALTLREALDWARAEERVVTWSPQAGCTWDRWYRDLVLPAGFTGYLSRAETHVIRLATVYALLDCSEEIRPEHLAAAQEVWRYASDSAVLIFRPMVPETAKPSSSGSSSSSVRSGGAGEGGEERLLAYLREHGQATRKVITCQVFSRNKSKTQIDQILQRLLSERRIVVGEDPSTCPHTQVVRPAPGREAETPADQAYPVDWDDWANARLEPLA